MRVLHDDWLTSEEARQVLSEVNKREIKLVYVRTLARRGTIQSQTLNRWTKVYFAPDCRKCKIRKAQSKQLS